MFECDVTLSADGEAYLLHDPKLDRTTDGQGVAVERNWADLSYLDAGSWHSPAYAGEPLLRLGALSRWLQANQLMVNLEIKPGPGDDVRCGEVVANEVARLWMGAAVQPLLSSFEVDALRAAQRAQPDLPRALLLEAWADDLAGSSHRTGLCGLGGATTPTSTQSESPKSTKPASRP
jgi:glycerophosphoryl diester phosphodiesterase